MAGSKGGRGGKGGSQTSTGPSMALVPYAPASAYKPQPTANLSDDQIIAKALGTQGQAATIKESIERVNPNYQSGRQWQTNCQRCVWAAELQRRGYDVVALPRTSDDTYAKADTSYANSFLNVAEGGLNLETVGSPWWKQSAADFKGHFTDKYDVGARGMLVGTNSKSGHVFNWEIINGKNGKEVRFYDTQPYTTKPSGYRNENLGVGTIQKKWFYFREARMDNVKVTKLVNDFVKPRK